MRTLLIFLFVVAANAQLNNRAILAGIKPSAAAAAGGGITFVQAFSAQTTSASFSTPNAGDLIVVMGHRDGSTTAPTVATGYTVIDNAVGANSNGEILGFKFSDGTETSSGTWANATSVGGAIWRNAGLGAWAKTLTKGTGTSITYGTLTMAQGNGTSWVASFGGHRTATDVGQAPLGMTLRSSATDIQVSDTAAGVASWSSQAVTVNASSGWASYTLEILAVPAGQLLYTFIQTAQNVGFSGTATPAVTLGQSVGSEPHILVVASQFTTFPQELVSMDKGGTLITIPGTSGGDLDGQGSSFGYVVGTTTATTPITLTYKASTSGNVAIYEIAYTGTGTPALDVANKNSFAGATPTVGPSGTMTGGNDCIITTAVAAGAGSISSVATPYTSPTGVSSAPSGNGFATALNVTSVTAPSWTYSSGPVNTASTLIGFGLNPTAFVTRTVCGFEGSSDNTSCTAALLKAAYGGWTPGVWTVNGPGAAMKFKTASSQARINSIARLSDGTSAGTSSTLGVQFLTSTAQSFLKLDYSAGGGPARNAHACSAGIWFFSDLPGTDASNIDVFTISTPAGAGFANAKFLRAVSGLTRTFELETVGGTGLGRIDISPSTWYWLQLTFSDNAACTLRVYESDGTTQHGSTITETHTGTGSLGYITLGQTASVTPTTGFLINFDSLVVDPEGSAVMP